MTDSKTKARELWVGIDRDGESVVRWDKQDCIEDSEPGCSIDHYREVLPQSQDDEAAMEAVLEAARRIPLHSPWCDQGSETCNCNNKTLAEAVAALDSIKEDGEENKDALEFLRAKVREHRQAYALDIFVNSEVITAQSSIDSISANMGRHMCDCFLRYIDEAAKEHEG